MLNVNSWNPVYVIAGTLAFFALAGAIAVVELARQEKCDLCARPFAVFGRASLKECWSCVKLARRRSRGMRPRRSRRSIVPIGRAWRRGSR